jgi:hypothetical protein
MLNSKSLYFAGGKNVKEIFAWHFFIGLLIYPLVSFH